MSLADLIKKRPSRIATAIPAINQQENKLTVAEENPKLLEQVELRETEIEVRRQQLLSMLADNPQLRLAVIVYDSDGDPVRLAIAIREKGSCEVMIPKVNFEPFVLLELIDKHNAIH